MTVYENEEYPLDVLQDIIILNAKNAGASVNILSIQDAEVNNVLGKLLTYTINLKNMDLSFITFATSGSFGTIQYTIFTFTSYFNTTYQSILDSIGGIEINTNLNILDKIEDK